MEESDFSDINEPQRDVAEEELDVNNPEHAFALIECEFNKVISKTPFKLYILCNRENFLDCG